VAASCAVGWIPWSVLVQLGFASGWNSLLWL